MRFQKAVSAGVCAVAMMALGQHTAMAEDGDPIMSHGGDTTAVFVGIDVMEHAVFGYGGAIWAIDGLQANSFAIKAFVGGGDFNYKAGPAPGPILRQTLDGDSFTFDVLGGYRFYLEGFQLGVYAGLNYWDIDHSPLVSCCNPPTPPNVNTQGDDLGFKIEGEITHANASPFYADVRGSYSTAFDTYWARARVGYNAGMIAIGPEGTVLGNDDYDQYRIGGFAQFQLMDTGWSASVSVGYADSDGSTAQDGIYGTANLATTF